jgi:hypothetical protein
MEQVFECSRCWGVGHGSKIERSSANWKLVGSMRLTQFVAVDIEHFSCRSSDVDIELKLPYHYASTVPAYEN